MDVERALVAIWESIGAITNPRFFETERGFQGQLLTELGKRLKLPDQVVIEQEYQKRLDAHGLTIRPDIVIHEPFDPRRHVDRKAGNYVVIELKLNSNEAEAEEDFKSLAAMVDVLLIFH